MYTVRVWWNAPLGIDWLKLSECEGEDLTGSELVPLPDEIKENNPDAQFGYLVCLKKITELLKINERL